MLRKFSALVLLLVVAVTPAAADKAEDENIEKCKRFYAEVANKGNMAVVDELVAEDIIEHEEFPGMVPGREGLKQFFTMMRKAFPDLKMTPEFFVADGNKVAIYATMSGTHKGEFMGMPPTGKSFSTKVIDIVRIEDGKAVEHWGVTDAMGMMEQLSGGDHGHSH